MLGVGVVEKEQAICQKEEWAKCVAGTLASAPELAKYITIAACVVWISLSFMIYVEILFCSKCEKQCLISVTS